MGLPVSDWVFAKHRACGTELVWRRMATNRVDDDGNAITVMAMHCDVCHQVVFPGDEVSVNGPYVAVRQVNAEAQQL